MTFWSVLRKKIVPLNESNLNPLIRNDLEIKNDSLQILIVGYKLY